MIQTGLPTPRVLPPPSSINASPWGPKSKIILLLEDARARLRAIDSMPRVTTNGDSFR